MGSSPEPIAVFTRVPEHLREAVGRCVSELLSAHLSSHALATVRNNSSGNVVSFMLERPNEPPLPAPADSDDLAKTYGRFVVETLGPESDVLIWDNSSA